jgi:hypothetical protein
VNYRIRILHGPEPTDFEGVGMRHALYAYQDGGRGYKINLGRFLKLGEEKE